MMSPIATSFLGTGRNPGASLLVLLGSCLILVSCATRAQNPFDAPLGERAGKFYRVRLEVQCRQCMISWRVGMEGETLQERRTWSHAVYAYPDAGEAFATLSVTPIPGSGPVSWVRIRIDGKIVAEEKNDEGTGGNPGSPLRTLSVETSIPPSA